MRNTRSSLLALLLVTGPGLAQAQEGDQLREGILARISRGGIWPPETTSFCDTSIALYPSVRFVAASLALEHGGTIVLYEALDAAGQLYLLDSPASFRLLHSRHFQGEVDSATAATIAVLAARFGGQLPSDYTLRSVDGWLLEATLGGGKRTPFAWRMSVRALVDGKPRTVVYEVDAHNGLPRLMTRTCDAWCYTTILEP
jgi:hypothetical protein